MSTLARVLLALLVAACASAGTGARGGTGAAGDPWQVKTREQIDLWLHGFALLQEDTTRVPYFRRGYRDELLVARNQRNLFTRLDSNTDVLRARLQSNPTLINAQFLAIYFANWSEMKQFMEYFFVAEGDPRRASNPTMQQAIATIGGYFPTAADREWARLLMRSLEDEYERFYKGYWAEQQRQRAPVLAAIDSLWRGTYYPKIKRLLDATQQRNGDLLLSLPLDGEGRSLGGDVRAVGGSYRYIAINFPATLEDAIHFLYVFAHEAVASLVNTIVVDNTTPAQRREGLQTRYESSGLVVGGYFVIRRIAPELREGYIRYYLPDAPEEASIQSLERLLTDTFALPQIVLDGIARQIETVLSGI